MKIWKNMFWKNIVLEKQFLSWAKYFQVTKIVQSFITCLDFVQACLYIKVYWLNYFCRFLSILWDFIWAKKTNFLIPENYFRLRISRLVTFNSRLIQESADRTGRPTCTNVHAFVYWRTADRAGRPLQRAELSGKFGRPHGSTDREFNSPPVARSTRPVDRRLQRSDF